MAVSKVILNGETLIDVTQKTVTPSNMLSGITALKNDGTDITGSIAAKSAADLIVSGSSVTVPSGMYAAAATTAVAAAAWASELWMVTPPEISVDSTGLIQAEVASVGDRSPITSSGYATSTHSVWIYSAGSSSYQLPIHGNLTASGSIVTAPSGWYGTTASKAVAAGSITIPSHSFDIKPDITLNSATGKIDLQKSLSYTIPVSLTSGYIAQASGPRVAATVDSSYQLPVKAAATIVPSTTDQVVASGYFLTGAQTVKGDSALIPSNIAAGVSIFGIEGTHQGGGNYQAKTVSPTGEIQVVLPDTTYDALSSVTVNAAALQSKVVTPSTEQQIITPDSSLYGIIPQGTVSENIYSTWQTIPGVAPPSPISVGTHIEGLIDIVYNTDKLGTIEINGDIAESHFESICTLTAIPAYQSTLQLLGTLWDSDGLNFILSLGGPSLVAATDIRFDSLPVYNYYGLSQVTVEAVAATTSYYLAQDSQGYITYSSIMPSGGEYYIFDVAGIKHIEGN